jgi:hypothetical protein
MNVSLIDAEASQPNCETAEYAIAALKTAKEQGKPYLIEWRQSDAKAFDLQGDAGCGCGPVE